MCLDWSLPDGSGITLCRRLVNGELPTLEDRPRILMLTAAMGSRIRAGLDSGADDYLVKPFAFAELSAQCGHCFGDDGTDPVLEVGPLRLDPVRGDEGREELDLTAKEFSLLHYFMSHHGHVLSQEHLLEHVWDEMADPMTNVVRVTVSNLRKKLGDPPLIAVPGRGYRLVSDAGLELDPLPVVGSILGHRLRAGRLPRAGPYPRPENHSWADHDPSTLSGRPVIQDGVQIGVLPSLAREVRMIESVYSEIVLNEVARPPSSPWSPFSY